MKFSSGHFYFNDTINLASKQLSLDGAGTANFTADTSTSGTTWLHFLELADGGVGISLATGSLSNVIICGNSGSYSCTLDRTKTYVAPEDIVTEIVNVKAYGVKGGSLTRISNVSVMNFYYGMWLKTGNIYIDNVNFRSCHYGLSIGNDTKVKGVYGWNIMTLLQIRGSLSSAVQVRADSIGEHLVHVISGTSIYLSDLDADYCVKSMLHLGDTDWSTISGLVVNGMHGRCCVYKAYDTTVDTVPVATDAAEDNFDQYGYISVGAKTTVSGLDVLLNTYGGGNPLDTSSNYKTPSILLVGASNNTIVGAHLNVAKTIPLTKEWLENVIYNLSTNSNNTELSISGSNGILYYTKSGTGNITVAKGVVETLE